MIEDYKKQFCEEYDVLEKVYVDEKTNKELNKRVAEEHFDTDIDFYDGYYCEKIDNTDEYRFYTTKIAKISDDDLNKAIMFENNNHLRKIDKNINFITTVLKIYLVLLIIAIIIICILWFKSTSA